MTQFWQVPHICKGLCQICVWSTFTCHLTCSYISFLPRSSGMMWNGSRTLYYAQVWCTLFNQFVEILESVSNDLVQRSSSMMRLEACLASWVVKHGCVPWEPSEWLPSLFLLNSSLLGPKHEKSLVNTWMNQKGIPLASTRWTIWFSQHFLCISLFVQRERRRFTTEGTCDRAPPVLPARCWPLSLCSILDSACPKNDISCSSRSKSRISHWFYCLQASNWCLEFSLIWSVRWADSCTYWQGWIEKGHIISRGSCWVDWFILNYGLCIWNTRAYLPWQVTGKIEKIGNISQMSLPNTLILWMMSVTNCTILSQDRLLQSKSMSQMPCILENRSSPVKSMEVMAKGVKVGNTAIYDMETIFLRLLTVGQARQMELAPMFQYELCAVPPSIIDEYGCPRKGSKSPLVHKLGVVQQRPTLPDMLIVDAQQLLYHVVWPIGGTPVYLAASMKARVEVYSDAHRTLVFDKYQEISPKDHERTRRAGVGTVD